MKAGDMLAEISALSRLLSSLLPSLAPLIPSKASFGVRAETWAAGLTCQKLWVKHFSRTELPFQDRDRNYSPVLLFHPVLCPPPPPEGLRNPPTLSSPKGKDRGGVRCFNCQIHEQNRTPKQQPFFLRGYFAPI